QIIGKIEDCLGGTEWRETGWFKATVEHVRKDIPVDALKTDKAIAQYGSTPALV
ncbi:unnamed protein product, partial [marine sediment metagenome]